MYSRIPSVQFIIDSELLSEFPLKLRTLAARRATLLFRQRAERGFTFERNDVMEASCREAERLQASSLGGVLNLSGVILHTGLGRARLSSYVVQKIYEVAKNHSNVELDISQTGKRGDRQLHVRDLLLELTGAEDAFVVNNCAAAVFLTLSALCFGREVLLSHGQMVEIGGSFRMPDIVRQSGCSLVGVGCTNKTRIKDYSDAITDQTVAVLRCHPSNFKVTGFVEEPTAQEVADFCHSRGLLFIDDIGNGQLIDSGFVGISSSAGMVHSLKVGADIVLASGDKLLGGPQAGIILGKSDLIRQISKHPLARAVRIDKLTLAGLEATLQLYLEGREDEIPVWRYLAVPLSKVRRMAQTIARAYPYGATVVQSMTEIGSGSLPGCGVPTWCAVLESENPDKLAGTLRSSDPSIVGRIEAQKVWLDPRTLDEEELPILCRVLKGLPDRI